MWKLTRPSIEEVASQLDSALAARSAEQPALPSDAERQALWALYKQYELAFGRPSEVFEGTGMRPEFLQLVHDAYKQVQDNGTLAHLRHALKLGAAECPYCGFGQIEDLDHHLQKAVYKLLSIFPLNLVPACATCNRGKPRKPDKDAGKHLLNVYLEDATNHAFFVARASVDSNSGGLDLRFEVAQTDGMSEELYGRLTHHIEIFRLQDRLRAQANIYLAAFDVPLADNFASGGAHAVKVFLQRCADANAKRFGHNDWRTALLVGLTDCEAFCQGGFVKALGQPQSRAVPNGAGD